jgi:hypothetical protein
MAVPHAEYHPYGLPFGTVRGFLSVLICSFFWIVLLLPEERAVKAPIAHFFLLSLVFLAFASRHHPDDTQSKLLPWLMRTLFVGGSAAVVAYVLVKFPTRLDERLTPNPAEIHQWPGLLGALAGGFGGGLFLRFVLGRTNPLYLTIRGWIGVVAMIALIAETVIQFVVVPSMAERPGPEKLQAWETTLVAITALYFGTRA